MKKIYGLFFTMLMFVGLGVVIKFKKLTMIQL